MSQKLKIVTIGGGSSYTPELLEGFIKRYHELPVTELWLVDVEEGQEKLDIIHALCQRMVEKAGVPMKVYKTLDRRAALEGAHFVTTQLRVGQLKAREKDERIPLETRAGHAGNRPSAACAIPAPAEIHPWRLRRRDRRAFRLSAGFDARSATPAGRDAMMVSFRPMPMTSTLCSMS